MLLAQWGPTGNSIVFVKDNDIYFKPGALDTEIRITNDSNENIYNGVCDWVYEGIYFAVINELFDFYE